MSRRFFMSTLSAALVFLLLVGCKPAKYEFGYEKAGAAMQRHAGEAGLQPEKGATLLRQGLRRRAQKRPTRRIVANRGRQDDRKLAYVRLDDMEALKVACSSETEGEN